MESVFNEFTNNDVIKDIEIDKNEVLRYLQYKGQNIEDDLKNTIDECVELTLSTINPRFIYSSCILDSGEEGTIKLKNTNLIYSSQDIYKLLKDCDRVFVMASTLGVEIERLTRKYSYSDLTKSIIIDSCATTAIEEICNRVQESVNNGLKKEQKTTTMRYSPGYGDLGIENNKGILDVLSAQRNIGVTINDSGIMIPRKSVVAIMGVSELKYNNKEVKKSCSNCQNRDTCVYKREDGGCANIRVYKE
ncbi:vitamin B12 dependent-methionine synthase activation domain-containing protein [Metaclostridioides mangenotii]|uniref:vitamin B12 dependent-methionine synthase activation domain-containing protein n=1 Tax=Metaclostridioides mangenotii TaxID=1540 RepID=UPI0026F100E4|nr:vitamin B12 dependent-methionine synthase activation domain-containing protein [Clostridioides mangenotii]